MSFQILNIDESLIHRFHVILTLLASTNKNFNSKKVEEYFHETLCKILNDPDINWYLSPQAVHKVLLHSGQLMDIKQIPIGNLSEEALEARNKDVRNFKQFFSRKVSRVHTNLDVMRRLMVSSDPYI